MLFIKKDLYDMNMELKQLNLRRKVLQVMNET